MKVLVVEDDPIARHLMQAVLGRLRYEAMLAATGAEAIEIAKRTREIDLAIVDVHLPDMLGLDIIAFLRKLPHFAKLPIVICTGDTEVDTVRRAALLGVSEYVRKPIQVTEFQLRIQRLAEPDNKRLRA
jgi:CheY-like chemotaxis protein